MATIRQDFKVETDAIVAAGYKLDPPDFERLNLWTHILFQLNFASTVLTSLIKDMPEKYDSTNFFDHYSRFSAVIVSYGRCFVSSGKGMVQLDGKQIFKGERALMRSHEKMMRIRHKVVAHTEQDELVRATIAVKETEKTLFIKHLITPLFPRGDFPRFLITIEFASRSAVAMISKYIKKLEREKGKAIEIDPFLTS